MLPLKSLFNSASLLTVTAKMSKKDYKYADLPVFKYQQFSKDDCTFAPPERIQFTFTGHTADDHHQHDDPELEHEPEIEIIDLDPPDDAPADDGGADDAPPDDGM